jgi:hypothetical protein
MIITTSVVVTIIGILVRVITWLFKSPLDKTSNRQCKKFRKRTIHVKKTIAIRLKIRIVSKKG